MTNRTIVSVFVIAITSLFSAFILPEIYNQIIQQHSGPMFDSLRVFLAIIVIFLVIGSLSIKW